MFFILGGRPTGDLYNHNHNHTLTKITITNLGWRPTGGLHNHNHTKKITITILGGGAYRRRTQSKSTRTAFTLSLFKSFSSYSRWEANRRLTQSQSHTSITITKITITIPGGRPTGGLHNHDQPEQLSHFHFHIFTLSLSLFK